MNNNHKIIFDHNITDYYLNISLSPYILSARKFEDIKKGSLQISKLLEKTIKLYYKDVKVKKFFSFDKTQQSIIESGSLDNSKLFISRYDGLVTPNGEFKLIEINTNFPGGVNRLDEIDNAILTLLTDKKYKNRNNFRETFVSQLKQIVNQFGKNQLLVLVYGSQVNDKERKSFQSIVDLLNKNNIRAALCHWKELRADNNNNLYLDDQKISIVFRAAFLNRVWEYDLQDAKKVFESLRANKIYFINSPDAYIGGAKSIFALWYSRFFQKFLSKEEIKCIKKYIPETYKLSDIKHKVEKNKYVIKSISGYGGEEVFIGKDTNKVIWDKLLNEHKDDYILQEFINPTKMRLSTYNTIKLTHKKVTGNININPWIINGKFAGISGRYAQSNIINIKQGGGIISVFVK